MIRFKLAEQIEKKQFRESRRITIQEAAEASGVNRMTLSKILNHRGDLRGNIDASAYKDGGGRAMKKEPVDA